MTQNKQGFCRVSKLKRTKQKSVESNIRVITVALLKHINLLYIHHCYQPSRVNLAQSHVTTEPGIAMN